MTDFQPLEVLRTLELHHVDYVLIGGIAARLRGAPLLTQDIDITPSPSRTNLERLSAALIDLEARLRTATEPEGVPFPIEPEIFQSAKSWTLVTRAGDVDLVFLPAGTDGYNDLFKDADTYAVGQAISTSVLVASLSDIIRMKEAAGRDKDIAALPLLHTTLVETARLTD